MFICCQFLSTAFFLISFCIFMQFLPSKIKWPLQFSDDFQLAISGEVYWLNYHIRWSGTAPENDVFGNGTCQIHIYRWLHLFFAVYMVRAIQAWYSSVRLETPIRWSIKQGESPQITQTHQALHYPWGFHVKLVEKKWPGGNLYRTVFVETASNHYSIHVHK